MSKLLSEEIVEAITLGDKEGFMSAFQSALAAKVSDALEIKKVEIASTLVAPASNEVVEEEVELDEEVEQIEEDAEAMVAKLKAKHKDHNFHVKNGRVVHTYYSDAKVKKLQKELSEEVEQLDELRPATYWNAAEKRRTQADAMKTMNRNDDRDKLDQRAEKLSNAGDERARDRQYNAVQDAKKKILSPATRRSSGISTKHIFTKANGETVYDKRNEEVEGIEEAKGESRISWRARTPEEIAKSDKRRKVKVTSAELEARAKARRAEKSE